MILCFLAGSAHAQWSGAWSNYFATETMAAECYSGSVERCQASGITPDSPSWWDYIVGKNHAKLVSVKNSIKACRPYFVPADTNVLDILNGNPDARDYGFAPGFTSDVAFLVYCGLPTNSLDETPYFKTQYPETIGGWHAVRAMLTNMTAACVPYDLFTLTATNGYFGQTNFTSTNSLSEAFALATNAWSCVLDDTYAYNLSHAFSLTTTNFPNYYVGVQKVMPLYHWEPSWAYNPASTNFSFAGSIFVRTDGYNGNPFAPFDDGVSTNFVGVFAWTNSVGCSGPGFTVSSDPTAPPSTYLPGRYEGWQYDDFYGGYAYVLQHFNLTNGFKYR